MGAFAMALVVVVMLVVFSFLVLLALRGQDRRRDISDRPVHPQAPSYRQITRNAEYYRPREEKSAAKKHSPQHEGSDPRAKPLPRCPLCDAAVGYDDPRCPKCGSSISRA